VLLFNLSKWWQLIFKGASLGKWIRVSHNAKPIN
jgi:hypothetical protein